MSQRTVLTRSIIVEHMRRQAESLKPIENWFVWCSLPGLMYGVYLIACRSQGEISPLELWLSGVVVLPSIILGVWHILVATSFDAKLKCPNCDQLLHPQGRVLATGRCPNCKVRILDRKFESFQSLSIESLSLEELSDRTEAHIKVTDPEIIKSSRHANWIMIKWAITGIALIAVVHSVSVAWEEKWIKWMGLGWPFVRVFLVMPGFIIWFWGPIRALRYVGVKPREVFKCHSCQRKYPSDVAELTGNCGLCGQVVREERLAPLEIDEPVTGSLTIADFCELALEESTKSLRMYSIVLVLAVIIFMGLLTLRPLIGEKATILLLLLEIGLLVPTCRYIAEMNEATKCPQCTEQLLNSSRWVIASRRCTGCGCRVLRE